MAASWSKPVKAGGRGRLGCGGTARLTQEKPGVTRAKKGVKASEWLSHPQLEALASPRASPESAVVLSQLLGPVRFNRRGARSTRVRPKINSRASGGTD